MRLALLTVAALLAVPAIAVANHEPDTTYEGEVTSGQGGTVELSVSGDGSTVNAAFAGLGHPTNGCTGVGFETGPVPINNHFFTYTSPNGFVTASGTFGPSFAAGGAQVLNEPCTTGSQAWIVDGPDAYFDVSGTSEGQGVLNNTAAGQTRKRGAKPGESESYELRLSNVGEESEDFGVDGCQGSKGFKVSYRDSTGNVTDLVSEGDYETPILDPAGVPHELTLKIKALKSVKKGKTKSCRIIQDSNTFVDVVKAKLNVN
jgi:hypothetical protein